VYQHRSILLTLILFAAALSACASPLSTATPDSISVTDSPPEHWTPPIVAAWQIQHTGAIDTSLPVDIYNLDMFDTSPETIAELRSRGVKVMCYFSAGTFEDHRSDADKFPASLLGNDLADNSGEKWIDIRNLQILAPIMLERITLATQKGCDGIDPGNVDGYAHDTGFALTPEDQLAYNIFLATAAHQMGLGIGLKNDLEQVPDLASHFDWAINENCFTYQNCHLLLPFVENGKSVFIIEYQLPPDQFCSEADNLNFNALQKKPELDAYRFPCR
jgi:hypothetical protein